MSLSKFLISILMFSCLFTGYSEEKSKQITLAITDCVVNAAELNIKPETLPLFLLAKLSEERWLTVLEREDLNKIMKEHRLNASEMTDPSKSIELGKLIGADYVLSMKIYTLGDKLVINGKTVRCKDGKVSGISRSYSTAMREDDIMKDASEKIAKSIIETLQAHSEK